MDHEQVLKILSNAASVSPLGASALEDKMDILDFLIGALIVLGIIGVVTGMGALVLNLVMWLQ